MKKLIDDAGGYLTYIEIRPFTNPAHQGWHNLKVTTVWEGARSGVEEQVKYDMNLSPAAFKNLKDLLNEV